MKHASAYEQFLYSTVRLEAEGPDGTAIGTAFLVQYERFSKKPLFLVTNKHVIERANKLRLFFTRSRNGQPLLGQQCNIEWQNVQQTWHGHPDDEIDVAVAYISSQLERTEQDVELFYTAIPSSSLFPTQEQFHGLDAVEEVVFIGYPNGLYDQKNLMPIIRRGTTATHPQLSYDGQPVFLIDASVFPGSSGSPVFTYQPRVDWPDDAPPTYSNPILFLGVVAAVLTQTQYGTFELVPIPTQQVPSVRTEQMIDLGVVFRFDTVVEAIEDFIQTHPSSNKKSE